LPGPLDNLAGVELALGKDMANWFATLALLALAITGCATGPWSAYGVVAPELVGGGAPDRDGSLTIQGSRSVESCLSVLNYPAHRGPPDARFCRKINIDFSEQPPNIYLAVRVDPVSGTSIFFGAPTQHACQAIRDRLVGGRGAADLGCRG